MGITLFKTRLSSAYIISYCHYYNLNLFRQLIFRRTDIQEGYIHRYNLPELKPGYYISAMDTYVEHYKQADNHKQVMVKNILLSG